MLYHFSYSCASGSIAIRFDPDRARRERSGCNSQDQAEQHQQQAAKTTPAVESLAQFMVPRPLRARSQPDRQQMRGGAAHQWQQEGDDKTGDSGSSRHPADAMRDAQSEQTQ